MSRLSRTERSLRALFVVAVLSVLVSSMGCRPRAAEAGERREASSSSDVAAAPARPPFLGLGGHSRPIAGVTPEAQRLFDQGLAFLSAFNHDEALRSFQAAATLAPHSVMPLWGAATAHGPHVNNPLVAPDRAADAIAALRKATTLLPAASPVERALVRAARARFDEANPAADRGPLDEAYARAMEEIVRAYPDDHDVAAWTAEAQMMLRPQDLWTDDGKPAPGTDAIVASLESVLARNPNHPLALHLLIHALEASPSPERAQTAADKLRTLAPGLGHLLHMPSHIDVRTGRWREAVETNQRAIHADDTYARGGPVLGFYRLYMGHNRHMLAYAAMMRGQSELALREVKALVAAIPADWARENAGLVDGQLALPFEVQMRFGRWDQILAEPDLAPAFPIARAVRRAARGIALAALHRPAEGRAEQQAFLELRAEVPRTAAFGANAGLDVLAVAAQLLEGELLIAEGRLDAGIAALQRAVAAEDELRYDEPPDWIQPTRHALGAALLRARRPQEAEAVYREDLRRNGDNGWSLFGLGRALRAQDRASEAPTIDAKYRTVWSDADVTLSSSCLCLPGV